MNSELAQIYLTTASVSILGYHHDLGEPVIRLCMMRQRPVMR